MKLKLSKIRGVLAPLFILLNLTSFAQYNISGRVTDMDGVGLERVDIFLHETHQGTASDSNGYYSIRGVKSGNYHLHITYAGYHSQQQDVFVNQSINGLNFVLEESVNELHQVVIESSLEKSDLKTNPLQVVHLDQHFLKQQGGTSFMKNLEKIPGVASLNNGVGVSKPTIRGLTGNRVVVTTDGIKQEGQQWGSDHGLEIDVNNADKIEIVKGASTLLYGSDAVAGVIDIRPELPKRKQQLNAGQNVGFNSLNNALRTSTFVSGNNKGRWFKVRYSRMQAEDYRVPAKSFVFQTTVLPIYAHRLKNTALKEQVVNAYAGISKNWGYWYVRAGYFQQKSGFFAGAFGVPNAVKLTHDGDFSNIELPYQTVDHYTASIHSNIMIKKNWLEVDAGIQQNQRGEFAIPHSAAFEQGTSNVQALDLQLTTLSLNARYFIKDSVSKTIVGFSAQHRNNTSGGYEFIIPDYTSFTTAVYGLYNRKLKSNWRLNSGVRLELNGLSFDSTSTPFYKNGLLIGHALRNPAYDKKIGLWAFSLGLNKRIKEDVFFKLNTAKTSRMLQANELASNGLHHGAFRFERGGIDLKPESAWQNDVSFFYERKRSLINVSGYFNHFFNFVYLKPSPTFARLEVGNQVYPYPEAGQLYEHAQSAAQHLGFEVELEYKLRSFIKLYTTSEYTQINNLSVDEYVPFVAPFSVKPGVELIGKYTDKWLEEVHFEANMGFYAAQNRVPRNDIPTAAYRLVNANLSFYLTSGFEINFSANNLLNQRYFNNLSRYKLIGLPEPGRSFVIQLSYEFKRKSKKIKTVGVVHHRKGLSSVD